MNRAPFQAFIGAVAIAAIAVVPASAAFASEPFPKKPAQICGSYSRRAERWHFYRGPVAPSGLFTWLARKADWEGRHLRSSYAQLKGVTWPQSYAVPVARWLRRVKTQAFFLEKQGKVRGIQARAYKAFFAAINRNASIGRLSRISSRLSATERQLDEIEGKLTLNATVANSGLEARPLSPDPQFRSFAFRCHVDTDGFTG